MTTKIEAFVKAYENLVKEHGVDFAAFPVLVPNEKGQFSVVVQMQPVDVEEAKKNQQSFISK